MVFPSLEMQRNADQCILLTFILCLKRNVSQTLKSSSCKKVFPKCVYHGYNLLRWMFFIPCDNWKTFFFIQTYRYPEVRRTTMLLLSLKKAFWKKSILYSLFPQQHYNVFKNKTTLKIIGHVSWNNSHHQLKYNK